MFDSVAGAVSDVGGALDKISGALGGAPGAPGTAAVNEPKFVQGPKIDPTTEGAPGDFAPVDENHVDGPAGIEFVHFGHVHTDTSEKFNHAERADDQPGPPDRDPTGRGIRYRAALQRESLLLGGYVSMLQSAMQDLEKGKGGVGGMLEAAGDLLGGFGGGGGGGGGPPKASDLNANAQAVLDAVKPFAQGELDYPKMHKGGLDLHQARADYEAFCEKVLNPPPEPAGGGGPLGAVSEGMGAISSATSSVLGAIGGPGGDIIALIQGIAFKPMDIYLGIHLRVGKVLEPVVAEAAREVTIDQVRKKTLPIFYAWAPPPQPGAGSGSGGGGGGGSGTGVKPIDDVKNTVDGARRDVEDFFRAVPQKTPTTPFLERIFGEALLGASPPAAAGAGAAPPPPPAPPGPPKERPADAVVKAFEETLDLTLPGFVQTLAKEVLKVNTEFLREIYLRLAVRDPKQAISDAEMYEGGRLRLLQRLVDLLLDQLSFLRDAKNFPISLQGMSITPGNLIDQAVETLNKEAGPKLDPAFRLTLGAVVDRLERARQQAVKENAFSMEAYLGLLPGLVALNFRNTFFPVWDLLVENTFGRLGFLGDIVKSASQALKDVQAKVDEGRDYAEKAKKISERAKNEGLQAGTGDENISGYMSDADAKAKRKEGGVGSKPPLMEVYPLPARVAKIAAKEIDGDQVDAVEPNEKGPTADVCGEARAHTLV